MQTAPRSSPTPHRPDQSDFMALPELAGRLGIGRSAAYDLARRDALPIPTHRVGKRFLFSRVAFEKLVEAQHDHAGDQPNRDAA